MFIHLLLYFSNTAIAQYKLRELLTIAEGYSSTTNYVIHKRPWNYFVICLHKIRQNSSYDLLKKVLLIITKDKKLKTVIYRYRNSKTY